LRELQVLTTEDQIHPSRKNRFANPGCGGFDEAMKKIVAVFVLLVLADPMLASDLISREDRSRFVEEPFNKAELGLRPVTAYIEMAKIALHKN